MNNKNNIQHLEERLQNNPKSLLFARLADHYLKMERIDEAIDICLEGIKHNPDYVAGNFVLCKAFILKKDYERAEAELKRVLSYDRQYLAAHKLLGDLMVKMGWENTAAIHYKEILRIDPMEEKIRRELDSITERGLELTEEKIVEEPKTEEAHPVIPEDEKESDDEKDLMAKLKEIFPEEKSDTTEDLLEEPSPTLDNESTEKSFIWPEETSQASLNQKLDEEIEEEIFSDFSEEEPEKEEKKFPEDIPEKNIETETPLVFEKESLDEFDKSETSPVESLDEPEEESTEKVPSDEEPKEKNTNDRPLEKPRGKKSSKIVSPTLGEIYTAQGEYTKAIRVFETLLEKNPEEKRFQQKIEELKKKLEDSSQNENNTAVES